MEKMRPDDASSVRVLIGRGWETASAKQATKKGPYWWKSMPQAGYAEMALTTPNVAKELTQIHSLAWSISKCNSSMQLNQKGEIDVELW